ncbi:hypothetical protein AAG747_25345 [Rapidithrix thailandica]|uniref:Uncharacterized protein n=1 Tax=Rapidithrix thailandica TaxID=413964 RepID=A0AAW9SJ37_9BACT
MNSNNNKRKISLLYDEQEQTNYGTTNPRRTSEGILFTLKQFGKEKYTSSYTTEVLVNGGQMVTHTEDKEFTLNLLEAGSQYKYKLDTLNSNIEDNMLLNDQLGDILTKSMALKDNLEVLLDDKGKLVKVTNKAELRAKWEELKKEFQQNEKIKNLPVGVQQDMYKKGDSEFTPEAPLAAELRNTLYYSTLFFPLYNIHFYEEAANPISGQFINSLLFDDIRIPLHLSVDISRYTQTGEYILKLDGSINKTHLSRKLLEEKFKKNYPFVKGKFTKYSYDFYALYVIDGETHQINYIEVETEEKVGDNLEAYQELEIAKIIEEPQNTANNE